MRRLQEVYTIKDPKEPEYYLGATYVGSPNSEWYITAKIYIEEGIRQVEERLGITICEEKTPTKANDHPEEDTSDLLDNEMHREYQSLIGMLQWIVSICRADICYAVSSLSRFCAAPREGHLSCALRVWGYLNKYPNRSININHDKHILPSHKIDPMVVDFADQYAYAKEDLDPRFPKLLGKELDVLVFFDSDHGHDKVTGRFC
jgi:hypothetical protein